MTQINSQARQNIETTPILVTGGHRTGTTWVGQMLAAGGQAAYISEPLNVLHRPGVMRTPVQLWYTYVCPETENTYLRSLQETLAFRYHLLLEIRSLRSRKDFLRMCRDAWVFTRGAILSQRPLIKDPFAAFSIPWFIERLGCQVVVTVRHPAAFASSLKRLDWPFQLDHLLAQPLLMRHWLEPFRDEILTIPREDIVGQASLLWKMIYYVVDQLRDRYPQIVVIHHEDLSWEPVQGFKSLYATLGLDFSPKVEQIILRSSSSENPSELSRQAAHAIHLDSRANLHNWKRRLAPGDLERIQHITASVVERYYPELGWD